MSAILEIVQPGTSTTQPFPQVGERVCLAISVWCEDSKVIHGDGPYPHVEHRRVEVHGHAGEWVGTKEERALYAFSIRIDPPVEEGGSRPELSLQYMGHFQQRGDTPWVDEGHECGDKDAFLRLEGIGIRLAGKDAGRFRLEYQAWIEGLGESNMVAAPWFCGTRGLSTRLEAFRVELVRVR